MSHAELVALVKALMALVERLEEENRQLKSEIERLNQPPANSRNSSQPSSRDQKSNQPVHKPKQKHGPPVGHRRSIRELIDHPDQSISVKIKQCKQCHYDLRGVAPEKIVRRQVTELPEFSPVVVKHNKTKSSAQIADASIAVNSRKAWKPTAISGRAWRQRSFSSNINSI